MRRKNGLRLPPKWGIPQVPGTRKVLEFVFIGPPSCPKLEKARHAAGSMHVGILISPPQITHLHKVNPCI